MKHFLILLTILFITPAIAGEKVNIVGTIFYSKPLNSFGITYLKDEKVISNFISVKNQNEFKKLNSLIGKSVRIEGHLKWTKSSDEVFSLKEELSISKVSNFGLNSLALDTKNTSSQDSLLSHEKKFQPYRFSTTIVVSDKTANTLIATSAVALGIAGGPVILAPVAAFGIAQLATN